MNSTVIFRVVGAFIAILGYRAFDRGMGEKSEYYSKILKTAKPAICSINAGEKSQLDARLDEDSVYGGSGWYFM